jgi:hypothetical protein
MRKLDQVCARIKRSAKNPPESRSDALPDLHERRQGGRPERTREPPFRPIPQLFAGFVSSSELVGVTFAPGARHRCDIPGAESGDPAALDVPANIGARLAARGPLPSVALQDAHGRACPIAVVRVRGKRAFGGELCIGRPRVSRAGAPCNVRGRGRGHRLDRAPRRRQDDHQHQQGRS